MRWLAAMRRLGIWLLVLLCITTGASPCVRAERQPDLIVAPDKQEFVLFGSSKSNKFHRSDCRYVRQISPGNLVGFRSREEAASMGYVPCKVCRP